MWMRHTVIIVCSLWYCPVSLRKKIKRIKSSVEIMVWIQVGMHFKWFLNVNFSLQETYTLHAIKYIINKNEY